MHTSDFNQLLEQCDDRSINPSDNEPLGHVVERSRRNVLKCGLFLACAGFLPSPLVRSIAAASGASLLGFEGVAAQTSATFDAVIVPPGYTATAFFRWGDPVLAQAPAWRPDASNSAADQLLQAGDNHDGMHFFPFPDAPNSHGVLVVNHEYVNPTLHSHGFDFDENENGLVQRPPDQVRKEQAAHGLSLIEIRRDTERGWHRVADSAFNRRIAGNTPMRIAGPLSGHAQMRTASDPEGGTVLGTLNNCSMGVTPWGTYLACEENFHNYFVNRDKADHAARPTHARYGIGNDRNSKYYGWESVDARFDATPNPDARYAGHVNEPNRFGWVVEVDPFDPDAAPVKRTAMGRLGRECATVTVDDRGRLAVYSGDDARGEYVYKFVPSRHFDPKEPEANRTLLDEGTLYAARFDSEGRGTWLALRWGENQLTPERGFPDQAAVLLNARGAADVAGATPMDRPEWVAVHPQTREVYVTLTNNTERGERFALDDANPRPHNAHGQILRWHEADGDPTATSFTWQMFVLAGDRPGTLDSDGEPVPDHLTGNIRGDIFSSPDGLAFDGAGRLWILTDSDDDALHTRRTGCNQMLCADPQSREIRRFLVGPRGAEITGITWTPDYRSMWVNVQHPAISYPASDGVTRPRSTTVLIERSDGGVIGG